MYLLKRERVKENVFGHTRVYILSLYFSLYNFYRDLFNVNSFILYSYLND